MDEATLIEFWRNTADKDKKLFWDNCDEKSRYSLWDEMNIGEKHEFVLTEYGIEYAIKVYHSIMEKKKGQFPGLSGLLIYLDISDEEYEEMLEKPCFAKWFTYAKRRRSQYLENMSLADPRTATACKLLLSQPENGAYGDKAPEKKPKMMTVTLRGIEDDNSANSSDN